MSKPNLPDVSSRYGAPKAHIIDALDRWIRQRPGLEYGNYGEPTSYRAELRSIARDLRDARLLLGAVATDDSITTEMLSEAFRAYSGRLTLRADGTLDYCTGQYWPTEYRKAAAAVLASALWAAARTRMPAASGRLTRVHGPFESEHDGIPYRGKLVTPGDWLRYTFRDRFGRGVAARWFS